MPDDMRALAADTPAAHAELASDLSLALLHVLERLSHLFAIYAALHILFPLDEHANAWIRKPNTAPLFGGRSALDRMLGGQVGDLMVVRQYLDAQRGGKA